MIPEIDKIIDSVDGVVLSTRQMYTYNDVREMLQKYAIAVVEECADWINHSSYCEGYEEDMVEDVLKQIK